MLLAFVQTVKVGLHVSKEVGPASLAFSGSLLEMQNLRARPGPTDPDSSVEHNPPDA